MKKKLILQIDNVRICEFDSLNIKIERYEEVYNPKEKQTINKWCFKGYSKTILNALEFIQRNELLIDKKLVSDLESYLKQVDESNKKLLGAINYF